jgi:hypothetical protein
MESTLANDESLAFFFFGDFLLSSSFLISLSEVGLSSTKRSRLSRFKFSGSLSSLGSDSACGEVSYKTAVTGLTCSILGSGRSSLVTSTFTTS